MPRRSPAKSSANPPRPAPASRRDFLRVLGAASALPLLGALPAAAQAPPQSTRTAAGAVPDNADAALAADARSLGDILQRRYGTRLTEAQWYAVRQDLEGVLEAGRALRAVPLQNADGPVTLFAALPPEA
jgi:hypothetical protein